MSNKHYFTNSSSIAHCDYHANGTMEIKFVSGVTYHYSDCQKEHYDALKNADSPGKHFHSIRNKIGEGKKVK